MKETLKRVAFFKIIITMFRTLRDQFGVNFGALRAMKAFVSFFSAFSAFRRRNDNPVFALDLRAIEPCLTDNTVQTPVEPVYFLQDSWAAKQIFTQRPARHYDIGSNVKLLGIVSQFVSVVMLDIRPPDLATPEMSFQQGSILALPFADQSINSLSSLCVVEHIGLGRYGDPIDCWGSEKAISELIRVLAPGGNLYISVPVDRTCRIYFNAHRAFSRDYLLSLFHGLTLCEERYIYGTTLNENYDPERGFGTGLFHWRR